MKHPGGLPPSLRDFRALIEPAAYDAAGALYYCKPKNRFHQDERSLFGGGGVLEGSSEAAIGDSCGSERFFSGRF